MSSRSGQEKVWKRALAEIEDALVPAVDLFEVPFTVAIKSISRWGAGCRDMVGTFSPLRETADSTA